MGFVDSIKRVFITHGASWVLWFLAALSIISVTIAVERALTYRKKGGDLRSLAEELDAHLAAGRFDAAITALSRSPAVAAAVAKAGLRLAHLGPEAADKAMQSASALERTRLEARLAYLGTLGNNAPFVGLFGTVVGVIQAFEALGHTTAEHTSGVATQAASAAVMTGIAEALVATAVGIAVALPAVAAYNYFQRRVTAILSATEVLSNLVLAYLSGHPPGRDAGPSVATTDAGAAIAVAPAGG
jgi:biopolymer transport protein ExbB